MQIGYSTFRSLGLYVKIFPKTYRPKYQSSYQQLKWPKINLITMIVSFPQKKLTTNFLSLSSFMWLINRPSKRRMYWSFEKTFLTSFLGGLWFKLNTDPKESSSDPYPLYGGITCWNFLDLCYCNSSFCWLMLS